MYTERKFTDSKINKAVKDYLVQLKRIGSSSHNSKLDRSICEKFFNTKDIQSQGIYNTIINQDFSVQVKLRSDNTITFDNYKKQGINKRPGWVDYLKTDYALFVFAEKDNKTVDCKLLSKEELKDYLNICRNWNKESKENKEKITKSFKETDFNENSLYFRLTPKD